jgi:hypothetical protein
MGRALREEPPAEVVAENAKRLKRGGNFLRTYTHLSEQTTY